jgi:hypothetical protein
VVLLLYYPLELLPFWLIAVLTTVAVVVLFLAPFIFSRTSRRTLTIIAGVAGVYMVVMTVFGQQIYEFFKGAK